MFLTASRFRLAAAISAAVLLANCAAPPTTIAADDEALCRYSEMAGGADTYAHCRSRLERRSTQIVAATAHRVEGYALLQEPVAASPTAVARDCKPGNSSKECDDLTGSIPAERRR